MIISEWLFDERKTFSVRFPYFPANEKFSKVFTWNVENFTNEKVKVITIWNTQNMQSLFSNKDKVRHHSCVIYRGICSCGADYIDETISNYEKRWNEHITGKDKNSDCLKHLSDNFDHEFGYFVLSCSSKNCLKSKKLEVYYIKTCQFSFNNQINSGITKNWYFYPFCIYFNCFQCPKMFYIYGRDFYILNYFNLTM